VTDDVIDKWLAHHEGVHPKEIAIRVGEARQLLTEMKRLRVALAFQIKRQDDNVCDWGGEVARAPTKRK
jgi:hypothetical protein